MIPVRNVFRFFDIGVGKALGAAAILAVMGPVAPATAQSQFPPLQNQPGGAEPYPSQGGVQGGVQGGFPPQQAPYPGPSGRPQQGYPNQQPFPQQGRPPGNFTGQRPFPQPPGPAGNFAGRPLSPQQSGPPGGVPEEPPFPLPPGVQPADIPPGSMGGMQAGRPPMPPSGRPSPSQSRLDSLMRQERRDFGVRPTPRLHRGAMHGPTPNQIPGGQLITTKGLYALMQRRDVPYFVFDVLGSNERLPGAIPAVPAAAAGDFRDRTQQQLAQFLTRVTRQNRQAALVFYCQGVQCWMSYNAALRAINLGYRNVLWYRGGIEAWKFAGLPTQPANRRAQVPQQRQPQPYRR